MKHDRVALVDPANRFVRWTDREEIHRFHRPHRTIGVVLFDRDERLLVQLRHADKLVYPRHWDISCAGHVEESDYPAGPDENLREVYAAVARRELAEELGVTCDLALLTVFAPMEGVHYEHMALFAGFSSGPFEVQKEEVEEVDWIPKGAFEAWRAAPGRRVTPLLPLTVEWLIRQGLWS